LAFDRAYGERAPAEQPLQPEGRNQALYARARLYRIKLKPRRDPLGDLVDGCLAINGFPNEGGGGIEPVD
jgi:hypothetical protein